MTDCPLFEDDLGEPGVLEAARAVRRGALPEVAVACFFGDIVADLGERPDAQRVASLRSETGRFPVWQIERDGQPVAVFHPGVGAPIAAAFLEEVVAMGVRRVVACGGAGALVPDLVLGHAIVVDSAVRDEGTSCHYLPPARVVEADADAVVTLGAVVTAAGVAHVTGRVWTTDAIYRETRSRVERRVAEGCLAVDMEASALMAVARYRGVRLGHLLMAGDSLAGADWEHRGWTTAHDARAELFDLAVRAAVALPQ